METKSEHEHALHRRRCPRVCHGFFVALGRHVLVERVGIAERKPPSPAIGFAIGRGRMAGGALHPVYSCELTAPAQSRVRGGNGAEACARTMKKSSPPGELYRASAIASASEQGSSRSHGTEATCSEADQSPRRRTNTRLAAEKRLADDGFHARKVPGGGERDKQHYHATEP
jgi:hypothetical protein